MMNRRVFSGAISAAVLSPAARGAGKLKLHIGHTGLTWIPLGGRITVATGGEGKSVVTGFEPAAT